MEWEEELVQWAALSQKHHVKHLRALRELHISSLSSLNESDVDPTCLQPSQLVFNLDQDLNFTETHLKQLLSASPVSSGLTASIHSLARLSEDSPHSSSRVNHEEFAPVVAEVVENLEKVREELCREWRLEEGIDAQLAGLVTQSVTEPLRELTRLDVSPLLLGLSLSLSLSLCIYTYSICV